MMKKCILLVIIFYFFSLIVYAQNKADDIIGYYYQIDPFTNEGSQSYIYKANDGTYAGKVCWVENDEKKKFLGLIFLTGLTFNKEENEWQNGICIYPGKNGTYKTYMSFESSTNLKVRGYWGISLFGKTIYWTKEIHIRVQH